MKHVLLMHILLVVGTASFAAQQRPEATTKLWTLAAIQKRLIQSGLQTRVDVEVQQPYLSVPGQVLVTPDGTEIQAYIYRTTSAREADMRKLDEGRSSDGPAALAHAGVIGQQRQHSPHCSLTRPWNARANRHPVWLQPFYPD